MGILLLLHSVLEAKDGLSIYKYLQCRPSRHKMFSIVQLWIIKLWHIILLPHQHWPGYVWLQSCCLSYPCLTSCHLGYRKVKLIAKYDKCFTKLTMVLPEQFTSNKVGVATPRVLVCVYIMADDSYGRHVILHNTAWQGAWQWVTQLWHHVTTQSILTAQSWQQTATNIPQIPHQATRGKI